MGQPEEIGKIISRILKSGGMEKGIKQKEAVFVWDKTVGRKIALQAKAIKVESGNIFVKVRSPVWRTELLLMKKEIIGKLNSSLGDGVIKDIIVIGE